ncbi:hypothetical protein C2S53_013280 [Perilla frutescens var. hirtella]|uniref:EF-hand domain-containing protein n=1 Tax=Perilla frutescens var. hirtella TaxID=608512 RepID=A0AAD4J8N2_PERFH|nr:hypothetical protein C2S53_013280 [Perilla frutescens var. hirtella]
MKKLSIIAAVLLVVSHVAHSRLIREGLDLGVTESCEPTYGILPCSSNAWGLLFLIVVFEILLTFGGRYVGIGSDLFFQTIGPSIFGASLFQLLGTFPQIVLVLGSTVMILTLIWGTAVILGSYDLSEATPIDKSGSQKSTPEGYGVVTDVEASYTARIMLIPLIPFLILLLAEAFSSSSVKRVIVLIALIVSVTLLISFILYQAFRPWIQFRRFEFLMDKYAKDKLMRLLSRNGRPDTKRIQDLFHQIDKDNSTSISAAELRVLLLGVRMDEGDLSTDRDVEHILGSFDASEDGRINEEEFVQGMTKLLSEMAEERINRIKSSRSHSQDNDQLQQGLLGNSSSTNTSRSPRPTNRWLNYLKAVFFVILGIVLLCAFAEPLINSVVSFATAANLPNFSVGYLAIPLAMNYRVAVQTIASSRQKSQKTISLTLSALYSGVYMNNVVSLIVFLGPVYVLNLSIDVFAEVLVVMAMNTLMTGFYILFLSVTETVAGRILRLNVSDNLISDGVDAVAFQPPFLNSGSSSSLVSSTCVHTYGFFPCADNIGGYTFQIVIYQYLLIIGGKLIGRGSKRIFNILGTGVYGATVFRILRVLPKIAMVIVSGVLKSKESAQESVSFGVGVYAGSTVFNLTIVWGMCVIFGRKKFDKLAATDPSSASLSLMFKEKLSQLKDTGTRIDKRTCYTAGIMLLSLIPYIIVQMANVFDSSFGTWLVILVALVVSAAMLLSYFLYQIFDPWIQERSLEYSKYENLLVGFLQHVQRHAKEKLIDDSGQPNIPVIKGLFDQTDKDADRSITFHELESLILEIQSGKKQVEKGYAISQMLKTFDRNKDRRIEEHEFIDGCLKWINEATHLAEKADLDVVQPVSKKRRFEKAEIEHIMARILKHAQSDELEAENYLAKDDGELNVERIKGLFKKLDTDRSNSLSRSELEELIQTTVRTGDSQLNHQEMVKKFMKDFDTDGDNIVDEQEFVHGMTKWLNKAMDVTKCNDAKKSIDEFDKIMWGEVENLVYEVGKNENSRLKLLTWGFSKSIFQVMLGIVILTFLSGPLKTSIQKFSDAIGMPSFFISFVIVPIALNAHSAISAIFPASQKSSRTSSLTFSEIYGGVVMNNIMGLSTLLAIVYIKGLEWDYSAEVLTILVVCAIIGILAYSQTTYPLWTCFLAFFLYPFSLLMYYVFQYVLGWD